MVFVWTREKCLETIQHFKGLPLLWKRGMQSNADGVRCAMFQSLAETIGCNKSELTVWIASLKRQIKQINMNKKEAAKLGRIYRSDFPYLEECDFLLEELKRKKRGKNNRPSAAKTYFSIDLINSSENKTSKQSEYEVWDAFVFMSICQYHFDVNAIENPQFDWGLISKIMNSKENTDILPKVLNTFWTNKTKIIYQYFQKKYSVDATKLLTVWEILDKLCDSRDSSFDDDTINCLLESYAKLKLDYNIDNYLLTKLTQNYPLVWKLTIKNKGFERWQMWEKLTAEYNQIKNTNFTIELMRKRWRYILNMTETRMCKFISLIDSDSDFIYCVPTDLEKIVVKRHPNLLMQPMKNYSKSFPLDDENNLEESHSSIEKPLAEPEVGSLQEESKSGDAETIGEDSAPFQTIAYDEISKNLCVYETYENDLEDLEMSEFACGLNSSETLSEEDISFLLVKFLASDEELQGPNENASVLAASSPVWENIAKKFLPYFTVQSGNSLYHRWRNIYVNALCNLTPKTRFRTHMTDLDWMILQSFPYMLIEHDQLTNSNPHGVKQRENSSDAGSVKVPVNTDSYFVLGNTEPQMKECQETISTDKVTYDSSSGQDLAEFRRHQKPIILSNKKDVQKMNSQLQTAAVPPTLNLPNMNKKLPTETMKFADNKKFSYRPNPKYRRDLPNWMIKPRQNPVPQEDPILIFDKKDAYKKFEKILEHANRRSKSSMESLNLSSEEIFQKFYSSNRTKKNCSNNQSNSDFNPKQTPNVKPMKTHQPVSTVKTFDSEPSKDGTLLSSEEIDNKTYSINGKKIIMLKKVPAKTKDAVKNILHKIPMHRRLKKIDYGDYLPDENAVVATAPSIKPKILNTMYNPERQSDSESQFTDSDDSESNYSDCSVKKNKFVQNPSTCTTKVLRSNVNEKQNLNVVRLVPAAKNPVSQLINISDIDYGPIGSLPLSSDHRLLEISPADIDLSLLSEVNICDTEIPGTSATISVGSEVEESTEATDPLQIAETEVKSPPPSNIDLRSYYSMMADSLDISNLEDIEMNDESQMLKEINCASEFVLPDNNEPNELKRSVGVITLSDDSDDDVPLGVLMKRKRLD